MKNYFRSAFRDCLPTVINGLFFLLSAGAQAEPPSAIDPYADISDIRIQFVDELNFGRIATSHQPGSVRLSPSTGVTHYAGVKRLGGRESIGRLILRGRPNAEFQVFLPESIRFNGSGSSLIVRELRTYPEIIGRFDQNGYAEINIGGLLEVMPGANDGDYTSQFAISIEYL